MASDALAVRGRLVSRYKEGLLDNATVLVSVLGAVMAFVAALLAMAAYTTTLNTRENTREDMTALKNEFRMTQVYTDELISEMKINGLNPPPPPWAKPKEQ